MEVRAQLRWVLRSAEAVLALPVTYLAAIAVGAAASTWKAARATQKPSERFTARSAGGAPVQRQARFAILVPAHNEELVISSLLDSLHEVDYPQDAYSVFVIADNCSDRTAAQAREYAGVRVLERIEVSRRGKGQALEWCFEQLDAQGLVFDAYLIIDADSVVAPDLLRALDAALAKGAEAAQPRSMCANPSAGPSTAMRWLTMTLINHVKPLGRNALGGSATFANGMCLTSDLLTRHPWRATGLTEDYDYYLEVVRDGVRVWYVPDAVIQSQMPTTFAQMRSQDLRWESSCLTQSTSRIALTLLRDSLRYRDRVRLDALAELLTPPLSLLFSSCLLLTASAVVLMAPVEVMLGMGLSIALGGYVMSAPLHDHPPPKVYFALLYAPGYVLWKVWVQLVLRHRHKHAGQWVRTARTVPTGLS